MIPRVSFGGVSLQAIAAVFRSSRDTGQAIGLMFTENQCGQSGGYVMNYDRLLSVCAEFDAQYHGHGVVMARDHLRPSSLNDSDIAEFEGRCLRYLDDGFGYLHLDFAVANTESIERLRVAHRLISRLREEKAAVTIELSLSEDDDISHLTTIASHIPEIIGLRPDAIVIPTGSLVGNGMQVGQFYRNEVYEVARRFIDAGIATKEHNADYLDLSQIAERNGVIDAFNVAPELGDRQSAMTLLLAAAAGLDTSSFVAEAYRDPNLSRWLDPSLSDPITAAKICGHYVFGKSGYTSLYSELEARGAFSEILGSALTLVVKRYLKQALPN